MRRSSHAGAGRLARFAHRRPQLEALDLVLGPEAHVRQDHRCAQLGIRLEPIALPERAVSIHPQTSGQEQVVLVTEHLLGIEPGVDHAEDLLVDTVQHIGIIFHI
jgi:hypothetical protein